MTNNTRTAIESGEFDLTKEELLRILAQAIELRDGDFRMERLLADFDKGNGFAKGWRMAVGECFRDSLDIKALKQTEVASEVIDNERILKWTQGSTFSFSQGDTIYDTPRAYQRWDIALESICIAFQILQAAPSRPRKEIIYMKRNTSYTGSLAGGNLARRQEVINATPPDWVEKNKLIEIVEDATGKAPSFLEKLCIIGALDRKVEVEPAKPR